MRGLKAKRVLITGGASGIGEAAVRTFAAAGAAVMLADVSGQFLRPFAVVIATALSVVLACSRGCLPPR